MKTLARFHRYLSCLVAPAMIFFAVSGAWQSFRYQDTKKDGSYTAPPALQYLSSLHKAEKLSPEMKTAFRVGQVTIAALFVLTALAGLAMAFRVSRRPWAVLALLAAGTLIPVFLALAAVTGP